MMLLSGCRATVMSSEYLLSMLHNCLMTSVTLRTALSVVSRVYYGDEVVILVSSFHSVNVLYTNIFRWCGTVPCDAMNDVIWCVLFAMQMLSCH